MSIHESGRYLFPGTGFAWDIGEGEAAGSVMNMPIEPGTTDQTWLESVEKLVPELATAFGPDIIVSQHGCDTHATDPLAHLEVSTTSMGRAARLVDQIAHRFAGGRWLATGGGGYGVYGVVPRAWAHVWLAGAHRNAPDAIPEPWRERWAGEAARYGVTDLPRRLDDDEVAGTWQEANQISRQTVADVRESLVPLIVRVPIDVGAWTPLERGRADEDRGGTDIDVSAASATLIVDAPGLETVERLTFARRLIANMSPVAAKSMLLACPFDMTLAVAGDVVRRARGVGADPRRGARAGRRLGGAAGAATRPRRGAVAAPRCDAVRAGAIRVAGNGHGRGARPGRATRPWTADVDRPPTPRTRRICDHAAATARRRHRPVGHFRHASLNRAATM